MSNPETTETASDHCVSASAHVVGVLAEALAQHDGGFLRKDGDWQCRCGAVEPVSIYPGALARHQASVVAALPNIAIVPTERFDAACNILGLITDTYRGLVMDTEKDQELHAKVIENADKHIALLRESLARAAASL